MTIRSFLCTLIFFLLLSYGCNKDAEIVIEEELLVDANGLYTDQGLAYPLDINRVDVSDEWISGAKKYAKPIRSLTSDLSFEDLDFLADVLDGKRVVQLGESGHGVNEFSQVKVRMIKYLHQHLGYDVLAFESSLFECYFANVNSVPSEFTSGRGVMKSSIFSVWYTAEVEELFDYIRETYDSDNPLILAGFDVQSSSNTSVQRPIFFKEIIEKIDTTYAKEILELDREVNRKFREDGTASFAEITDLVSSYDDLAQFIDDHMDSLVDAYQGTKNALHPIIAYQTAKSMSLFIKQLNASVLEDNQLSFEIRDKGMADNLSFLMEEIYPLSKIMVWAHNFHIRHDHPAVEGRYFNGIYNMGKHVHNRYQSELYTIGLFMYTGVASGNNRDLYNIEPASSGSLEAILHTTEIKHSFVDFTSIPNNEETSWIFNPSVNKAWGAVDLKMIPSDQYNGVVFIQDVTSPLYR